MTTLAAADAANPSLSMTSGHLLWSSAAVLALAMLAFCVDLAGGPGREARAAARREQAATAVAADGGDTAVLTQVEAPAEVPEKRQWAGIGMSLAWLGTFLLLGAVLTRGLSVMRPPLGNMYEFALAGSSFAMVCYLLWSLRRDVRWLGAFVTGAVVLVQMAAALIFYTAASQLMPSLQSPWLSIHVTVATLSVGLFILAAAVHLLYFLQAKREDGGLRRFGFLRSVPDAATLDRTAYGVLIVAFPLWTFTLIAGAIWADKAWGRYWGWDPKEVWTLVIWVLYAAYLHARMTAGWSGRKAAWVAMAGFACVLINYGIVNVYFVGQHSYSGM
ncbi:c-type cytochrome biogenesis protein CcsB [Calidifontibacter sp. DB0510]|uniref:C-type cytochrome biogenesis protein CcsB n=1 Tax=Metallococcus carri TaxID=1656884 RepID=A0A967E9Y1_9MICO|nr:c-type cytochrome biogenesis protein CcsB [Metallococcus carri]NHN55309.1 c-type cytochrome biogenesis protein CcsB [Metallococcus carri]NOP36386.1 c-type cytochrome biogenesis protein CcsB [Calidifontibacter sp. DB2511S]